MQHLHRNGWEAVIEGRLPIVCRNASAGGMARMRSIAAGAASVLLLAAGCTPIPSTLPTSASAVPPTPTAAPTGAPTAAVPAIAPRTDATFTRLAGEAPQVGVIATGDTFVIGGNTMDSPPHDLFAYDPATGVQRALETPRGGTFLPEFGAGELVVGGITKVVASKTVGGVVIDSVVSGQARTIWPSLGYDHLDVFDLADGYAFGQMVKLDPASGSGAAQESRAIIIELATGVLTDLTPPDVPSPALVQVRGLAAGRALVAVLPGGADVAGNRPITRLVLVDLATGVRSTPSLDVGRLSAISEVWEPDAFRLEDDLIVGVAVEIPGVRSRPFIYHLATSTLDEVPLQAPMQQGACRFRLDATRLVCYASDPPNGQVFLYDTEQRTSSAIPTPGLTGLMWPRAVANGRIVITDNADGRDAPLVHVLPPGSTYRLAAGGGSGPYPIDVAIVGNLIVGSSFNVFEPRVWPLP